jgi:hypothetical protein
MILQQVAYLLETNTPALYWMMILSHAGETTHAANLEQVILSAIPLQSQLFLWALVDMHNRSMRVTPTPVLCWIMARFHVGVSNTSQTARLSM